MYLVTIFKSAHENFVHLASRHCSDSPVHPWSGLQLLWLWKLHVDCWCFTFQSTIFSHVGTIFCLPGLNQY